MIEVILRLMRVLFDVIVIISVAVEKGEMKKSVYDSILLAIDKGFSEIEKLKVEK